MALLVAIPMCAGLDMQRGCMPVLEASSSVRSNCLARTGKANQGGLQPFCGDSAYVGSGRQSMDTTSGTSVTSMQRRSRAFSLASSYPSQCSMQQGRNELLMCILTCGLINCRTSPLTTSPLQGLAMTDLMYWLPFTRCSEAVVYP